MGRNRSGSAVKYFRNAEKERLDIGIASLRGHLLDFSERIRSCGAWYTPAGIAVTIACAYPSINFNQYSDGGIYRIVTMTIMATFVALALALFVRRKKAVSVDRFIEVLKDKAKMP